ncbi:MAG: hypothetical protein V3U40_04860, partial [Candidatus Scalindua sediminis]
MDKKRFSMKKYFLTLLITIFTFSLVLGYAGPTVTIKAETQEEELEKISEELEKLGSVANTLEKSLALVAEYVK